MGNVMLRRCCGNCEWSISPENEEEIMRDNHYEKDDPTRPRAGDCCLGIEHNGNYVCDNHEYTGGFEIETFYDEKYIGQGYFMVALYNDYIVKFLKLYRTGTYGNYNYGFKIYEYDLKNKGNVDGSLFEVSKSDNDALHMALTIFAEALSNNVIWDKNDNGFITSEVYEHSTALYFTGKCIGDFIEIQIDNTKDDKIYNLVSHLYRNMAVVTSNMTNQEVYSRVRKITKNNNK